MYFLLYCLHVHSSICVFLMCVLLKIRAFVIQNILFYSILFLIWSLVCRLYVKHSVFMWKNINTHKKCRWQSCAYCAAVIAETQTQYVNLNYAFNQQFYFSLPDEKLVVISLSSLWCVLICLSNLCSPKGPDLEKQNMAKPDLSEDVCFHRLSLPLPL